MGHTNSTTNYSLPQFITTDKPAWLTDVNNAYLAIDTGMNNAQTKANTADANAAQAILDASAASTAAATADAKGAGAVASIAAIFDDTATYAVGAKVMYNNLLYTCTVAVTTPGAWTGSANWTRSTVIGIIPEDAADVSYTPSGIMSSTNVQNAIDEVAGDISSIATRHNVSLGTGITGNLFYYQIDKLVTVVGEITTTSGMLANAQVFYGFPTNANGAQIIVKALDTDGVSADWVLYCGNGSNAMLTVPAHTGVKTYCIYFSYITN